MTIDLRLLITPVMPFVFILLTRATFWFAGSEGIDPDGVASVSLFASLVLGPMITAILFAEKIEIGKIRIGKANNKDAH